MFLLQLEDIMPFILHEQKAIDLHSIMLNSAKLSVSIFTVLLGL